MRAIRFMRAALAISLLAALGTLHGCGKYKPAPNFSADKHNGPAPLLVQFTDNTSVFKEAEVEFWQWTFGDGAVSNEQNPLHQYDTPGRYTVSLFVRLTNGEEGAKTANEFVTVTEPGR